MSQHNHNLPKLISLALAIVTFAGSAALMVRYQNAVGRSEIASGLAYAAIQTERHASSDASKLRRTERAALASLRGYATASTIADASAALLEHLERLGKAYNVSISGVDASAAGAVARAAVPDRLKGQDIVLRLRGAFRNVLLVERRLSTGGTLLRVDAIDFEGAGTRHPIVVASTVHARLYYLELRKEAVR
ncbi:MAG TPA: hypothetical protein VFL13_03500 [Candidatus Baltobacteraceae bacterium]|nr:hypothetical protein [Candidatus Baltobacteraceae bacterium]